MPTGGFIGYDPNTRATGNAGANSIYLTKVTAPRSGTVTAVLMDVPAASSGISFKALVYDGGASALLATGSAVTSVAANYNRFPLTANLSVTAGTDYYVGYVCANSLNVTIGTDGSGIDRWVSGGQSVTSPANPLGFSSAQSNGLMVALEMDGTGSPGFGFGLDSSPDITLSVSNTRASVPVASTPPSTGFPGARSVLTHKTADGKFYAEIAVDGIPGGYAEVGLGVVAWSHPQAGYNVHAYFSLLAQQGYFTAGATIGVMWLSGDVIGIAYDGTTNQAWWNKNNGPWYGSSSTPGNPAAGTGGLPIQSTQWPMALTISFGNSPVGGIYTLNETAGSLYYAPPSGFSPWSPASYTSPPSIASAALTQAMIEQWGSGTSQVDVFEVALEEWAVVSTAPTTFNLTQMAIEEWVVTATATRNYVVSQIGIEEWARAGAADTQFFLTQVAVEQWATVAGLPTTIVAPAGVFATGSAGQMSVFPGPVAAPAGVYATGAAGSIFALAGGTASRFVFFMQGVF